MSEAAVQLKVAGQTYRVVTSASEGELTRLAEKVEDTLESVTPLGRQPSPQNFLLAAISLAHELEEERRLRTELEARYAQKLSEFLSHIDRLVAESTTQADTLALSQDRRRADAPAEVFALATVKSKARSFER